MDPLSVIASSIAIAGAVSKGLEVATTVHSASNELHPLMNDASETRILLQEIERCIRERQNYQQLPQGTTENIFKVLVGAKHKLQQLDTIINGRLIDSIGPSGEAKVARLAWLRHKPKVKRLQQELKRTRLSLAGLWGAANISDMSRIQLKLDEFAIIHENQKNQLSEHGRYLEYISGQYTQPQPVGDTSNSVESSVEVLSIGSQQDGSNLAPSSNNGQDSIIPRRQSINQYLSPSANGVEAYNTVRVRASHYRRSPCEGWCSCVCHKPCYLQTPESVDFLLGSLFVGYSGFPIQRRGCNERACRQQSIPTIKVSYYFPRWLLTRVIQFVVSLSYMEGPKATLSVPRVIPDDAPVLSFAVQGNFKGIQTLFSQGVASPWDVGLSNGRTALHYAVNYNHPQLSRFLIETGADANLEDKNQTSSISIAWERIFGRFSESSSTASTWRSMFDDEDYLESRNFSPLHKVVLSLARGDLRQQLEASTSTIDDRDADGLTALHWATARGNVDVVKVLLEFGAAPNVYSRRGHSPLTWAAQSPSARRAEIVQELLNHGADVNHPDSYNRTPLLNAAADPDDPTCIKLFVNCGADVNWQDCHKRTPLGYAAKMGNCHNLSYLLSQGADPHIPDHWGHTPFSEAVQQNHHGILQLLLQEDAIIPGSKLLNGLSILHLAAAHGDVETLRILASGDTRTLNLDKRNAEGLTAEDLFNLRSDASLELNEAYHALIETIIQNHSALGQGEIERIDDADLDVDEFADAVEYQNVEELDT